MGLFSKLLLPGRLRTGPTALLPARPDQKALLAIAQLADPEARIDGEDIVAGGSRIQPPIELTEDILAKLGVPDEGRLWACRIAADGPLPVDFFDKSLAEGVAYRLGGWSLCRGEPLDPAEDGGDPLVYLPAVPEPREILPLLSGALRHADAVDTEKWPEGELIDGIVHIPVRRGRVTDVYAGADVLVAIEEGHRMPPAAQARWPYLTEISIARITPRTRTEETPGEAAKPDGGVHAPAADGPAEEATSADPHAGTAEDTGSADAGTAGDVRGADAGPADATSHDDERDADEARDADGAEEVDGAEDADEALEALRARAAVALMLAEGLRGIAADSRGFQLTEADDVLPGRFA